LNATYLTAAHEHLVITSPLTVEHIMPQRWEQQWLLPDGSKGLSVMELFTADDAASVVIATRRRNELVQTMGNLTVLSQPLNSSLSNAPWEVKKPQLMKSSLLPINLELQSIAVWDEAAIQNRSIELFKRAVQLWPGP
jgi:hypothetical protein